MIKLNSFSPLFPSSPLYLLSCGGFCNCILILILGSLNNDWYNVACKIQKKQETSATLIISRSTNYHCHHHYTTVHYSYLGTITYNFQVQVFITAVEVKHFLFRLPL